MEMRMCKISLQSFIMSLYSVGDNNLVSLSRSNQYSVSAHSLRDIVAFTKNSFLLMEYWASVRFAPMDVPERSNCLASTYSCLSSHRYLYRLYILMANFRLFSNAMFISSKIRKTVGEGKEKRKKMRKGGEKREMRKEKRGK